MRSTVVAVVLVATAIAAVQWFPNLRDQVELYLLQRQCMQHEAAADEFVYHEAPGFLGLLSDKRYQMLAGQPPAAFLVPRYWREFYRRLSPPGLRSHGTVFLRRMTTPGGKTRLVAIDMSVGNSSGATDSVLLTARVIEPGTLIRRPRLLSTQGAEFISYGLRGTAKPGQLDPKDPKHLLLFDGRIQGWLEDNDHVKLAPREATPPAPSSPASPPTSAQPATRPLAFPAGR